VTPWSGAYRPSPARPEIRSGPPSRTGASVSAALGQRWKPGSAAPKVPLRTTGSLVTGSMALSEPLRATGWSQPAVSSSASALLRWETTSAERREVASRTRTSVLKSRT
jgi:hypothetical protein